MLFLEKLMTFTDNLITFEPKHLKTNNMACPPSEDQPGHSPSLISSFAVHSKDSQGPKASKFFMATEKTLISLGGCPG